MVTTKLSNGGICVVNLDGVDKRRGDTWAKRTQLAWLYQVAVDAVKWVFGGKGDRGLAWDLWQALRALLIEGPCSYSMQQQDGGAPIGLYEPAFESWLRGYLEMPHEAKGIEEAKREGD